MAKQPFYFGVFSRCELEFYPQVLLGMPSSLPSKNAISRRAQAKDFLPVSGGVNGEFANLKAA
jgi:hypothetical protein